MQLDIRAYVQQLFHCLTSNEKQITLLDTVDKLINHAVQAGWTVREMELLWEDILSCLVANIQQRPEDGDAILAKYHFMSATTTSQLREEILCRLNMLRLPLASEQLGNPCELRRQLDFLLEKECTSVTLQTFADVLNVNPSYLSSAFKKQVGIGFKQYVLAYKMSVARQRLMMPQERISAIASLLGYTDSIHFSKAFKRFNGITPSEFRVQFQRAIQLSKNTSG